MIQIDYASEPDTAGVSISCLSSECTAVESVGGAHTIELAMLPALMLLYMVSLVTLLCSRSLRGDPVARLVVAPAIASATPVH